MMRVRRDAARGSDCRSILRALAAAAALLGVAHAPAIAAPNCTANAPTVDFSFDIPPPAVDNTASHPELQRMVGQSQTEMHGGKTLGLYRMRLAVPATIHMTSVTSGEAVCVWVAGVAIRIEVQERRIFVINDWKEGTCPYTSILAHERKHQAVDDTILRERAAIAKRKIAEALARIGVVTVAKGQQAAAQERLKTLVNDSVVKQVTAEIVEARNEAQRDVDAGLEYSRVAESCREFRAAR